MTNREKAIKEITSWLNTLEDESLAVAIDIYCAYSPCRYCVYSDKGKPCGSPPERRYGIGTRNICIEGILKWLGGK